MMLSDISLKKLALEHDLVSPFNPSNCEGATINVTLNSTIKRYISPNEIILGEKVNDDQYEVIDLQKQNFYLQPNESVLVRTVEFFKVPDNMAAQILERYSVKLLGLSISPASYMNPGYEGTMSFVAYNQTPKPIRLTPGIKFAQLAMFELSTVSEKPYRKQDAKYLGSDEVNISRLYLDKDIQEFLTSKGINNVSTNTVKELGDHLMGKINKSANKVANELRQKFGDPK